MIGPCDGIYFILAINCAKFQVHGCGAMFCKCIDFKISTR